jgi:hypothetical protein
MTCCIGKARIYYKEPIGFQLFYSGSANGEVIAQEPLITTCDKIIQQTGNLYTLTFGYTATATVCGGSSTISETENNLVIANLSPPLGMFRMSNDGVCPQEGLHYSLFYYHGNPRQEVGIYIQAGTGPWRRSRLDFSYSVSRMDEEEDPFTYTFKVIGTETGTIYREISGLPSCPAVDNVGCVMGEENYYDTLLPNQIPGGPIESSCFKKVPAENNCFHVVLETKYKPDAFSDIPHKKLRPPKIETRSQLYLCGLPGCPAEYRIVCCPDGECEPERCPPDTDCELDCGSFVCCYKNGKVIKTVRK